MRDRNGLIINILALDVLDGRVQAIRVDLNPDKLAHLGTVADAWAVARETNEARRAAE
jgi:RNA polymerase sigma-70 factor (ECF subfamily)